VVYSLDAAAELIRIAAAASSSELVLRAADSIRKSLEIDPQASGHHLSESLYYIDDEPLRAFFVVDEVAMVVEVTDFRAI